MSASNPIINLQGRQLISAALLTALIISVISIMIGGFSVGAQDNLEGYAVPVGGTVLPVDIATPPIISTAILMAIMVIMAVALTAVVFKDQK